MFNFRCDLQTKLTMKSFKKSHSISKKECMRRQYNSSWSLSLFFKYLFYKTTARKKKKTKPVQWSNAYVPKLDFLKFLKLSRENNLKLNYPRYCGFINTNKIKEEIP